MLAQRTGATREKNNKSLLFLAKAGSTPVRSDRQGRTMGSNPLLKDKKFIEKTLLNCRAFLAQRTGFEPADALTSHAFQIYYNFNVAYL